MRTINLSGFGAIYYQRSRKRARRITIVVSPAGIVRVSVPYGVSLERAHQQVSLRRQWMQNQIVRMQDRAKRLAGRLVDVSSLNEQEKKKRLVARATVLAQRHGFSVNKITIRRQRSRWGSCSHNNSISLNIKIIQLPDALIDYIIVHELVHTRIKNHQQAFWQALFHLMSDAAIRRKQLRSYPLELLAE